MLKEMYNEVPTSNLMEVGTQNRQLLAELGYLATAPTMTLQVETPVNGLGYQYKERILMFNEL